jgi:argininosuccinate lyase
MERAAKLGYATATDLAHALVYKGVPFRDAHEAVAKVVKHAMGENVGLDELPLSVLQSFHPAIGADVQSVLTLKGSLGSRNVLGGTAPEQVKAQIARHRARLGTPKPAATTAKVPR